MWLIAISIFPVSSFNVTSVQCFIHVYLIDSSNRCVSKSCRLASSRCDHLGFCTTHPQAWFTKPRSGQVKSTIVFVTPLFLSILLSDYSFKCTFLTINSLCRVLTTYSEILASETIFLLEIPV